MKRTFCLIIILSLLVAGCLETKEAWPATVSDSVLDELGWSSLGDAEKQSQSIDVAGNTVSLNMAIMNYRDDALAEDIAGQVQEMTGHAPESGAGMSELTSKLITIRLVLPAGISIPSSIVNKLIDSQLETMASQNNIRDFHSTGKKAITLSNGDKVDLNIFKGSIGEDFASVDMKGIVTSWSDSGSTILVFGVLPDGDIIIEPISGEKMTIKIDSQAEVNKMEKLIQNVN